MMVLLVMQLALAAGNVKPTLTDVSVVVDAGHGALNPGKGSVVFKHKGKKRHIVEKAYTCDVAAWLVKFLKNYGAEVTTTTRGGCLANPRNGTLLDAQEVDSNMFFSTTGAVVHGRSSGLYERFKFIETRHRATTKTHKVVVSIHYDNNYDGRGGAYFIAARNPGSLNIASLLARRFSVLGVSKTMCGSAVVLNHTCYIDNLYLLERASREGVTIVLAELGNVYNAGDRSCMLSVECRKRYAREIALSIWEFVLASSAD